MIKQSTYKLNMFEIEQVIAQIYIYLLPFRMISQFAFIKNLVGVCALYIDFIFHMIGLMLWICNSKGNLKAESGENQYLINDFLKLIVWLNTSSIIMAFFIQSKYGNIGNENAFGGVIGMIIYFFQYALMLLYNMRVLTILEKEKIHLIFHRLCTVLLIIGYTQVLVMNGIGGGIYDRLNFMGILNNSSHLPKLCLTGSEGASAGSIISILVMPVLLSDILIGQNIKSNVIKIILWLIPLYFTNSSTAYILFAIEMTLFLMLMAFEKKQIVLLLKGLLVTLILVLVLEMILKSLGLLTSEVFEEVNYLLFEKATDTENGSTISRTVPLLVNWGAFKEYPILGVGNGLQGYFYEKYFPTSAFHVAGSDVTEFLKTSKNGISNGGVFFPSLLSGYGIIGCILIVKFIIKTIYVANFKKHKINNFFYMWILAGIAFIITGFQGDMYGRYYVWFMISLPFISASKKEKIQDDHITNINFDTYNEQTGNIKENA